MKFSSSFLSTVLLVMLTDPSGLILSNVSAHGPPATPEELAFRSAYTTHAKRSLNSCAAKIYTRDRLEQRHHRRAELVQKFVQEKERDGMGIDLNPMLRKRDLSDKLGESVESLFPKNPECILTPELTIGPYYASHQLIREDIREDIPGVELLIALEVIDINTCEPVPEVMVDFWHCTNEGVYSAFESEGSAGETFTRGLQATGSDGIVTITSIFPGWYTGRTTHIHVAAHLNGTVSADGDYYSGGTSPHIGQLFFEDDLLDQIQKSFYYSNNTNQRTLNDKDSIFQQFLANTKSEEHTMSVTFVETNNINSGLVATMVIGIDTSKNYTLSNGAPSGGGDMGAPPGGNSSTNTTTGTSGTTNTDTTSQQSGTGSSSGALSSFANLLPMTMTAVGVSSILSVAIGVSLFL